MKNWVKGLVGLVVEASILVGCAPEEKKEESKEDGVKKVRLGVMPSTDNIPFLVAHKEEFDKKNGVEIELEMFKSAPDRDAAFQAGKVDGVISDLVGLAIYLEGGMDVKTVAAPYDQFDLLSGDKTIKSVEDLREKEVVFSKLTGTAYAVDMMLKDKGLLMSDIKVTEIPQVPARLELLKNNKAAAAILPEPFITMGKTKGMHVVSSTRDLGINPFAIVFGSDFIKNEKSSIQGMFDAYNEGSAYIAKNEPSEFLDIFIKDVGFPSDLKDKIEVPDFGKIEPVKESDVTSALEWSRNAGLLSKNIKPKEVMSNVYFK